MFSLLLATGRFRLETEIKTVAEQLKNAWEKNILRVLNDHIIAQVETTRP